MTTPSAPLDVCNGLDLSPGTLTDGASYLSEPMEAPKGALYASFDIRVTYVSGTPTLTVKIRQGNRASNGDTLTDRAITSPTSLAAMSDDAQALVTDLIAANFVQLEIACTGGVADVTVYGGAR